MKKFLAIAAGAAALLLLGVSFSGITVVDEGNRGVKKTLGSVHEQPLEPNLYFYNPFTTSITEMTIQERKYEATESTYTRDVQEATIDFSVNYRLQPGAVVSTYSEIGSGYAQILIPQAIAGAMKTVIGQYDAVTLIAERESARVEMQERLVAVLSARGIDVVRLEIRDIRYKNAFEDAVEAKVTAIQRAEEERNRTVQVQEQANQAIIKAEADAESIRIQGEALSENPELVSLKWVERWDGKLPTTMLSDSGVLLSLEAQQ